MKDEQERKNELKQIAECIASGLDGEGRPLFELKLQLGRLLSHLESEQRTLVLVDRRVSVHEKLLCGDPNDPDKAQGIIHRLAAMQANQERSRKMLNLIAGIVTGIATTVGGAVILKILKLV